MPLRRPSAGPPATAPALPSGYATDVPLFRAVTALALVPPYRRGPRFGGRHSGGRDLAAASGSARVAQISSGSRSRSRHLKFTRRSALPEVSITSSPERKTPLSLLVRNHGPSMMSV